MARESGGTNPPIAKEIIRERVKMQIDFNGGRFVSGQGELNYQPVLDNFPKAKIIRIITFNISKNQSKDALLNALKRHSYDVQFITNIHLE